MVQRFDAFVRSIVSRRLGAKHASAWEDVIQQAWFRIFVGILKWRGNGRFCTFVSVITKRTVIDFIRKDKTDRTEPRGDGREVEDPLLGPAEQASRREVIVEALEKLRDFRSRLTPEMDETWHLLETGLGTAEIAAQLRISRRAVQWRWAKIAVSLTKELGFAEQMADCVGKLLPDIVFLLKRHAERTDTDG